MVNGKNYGLIDLHLHLDGSLSVRTVRELARMQQKALPEREEDLLRILQVSGDCKDLNEYLEKFDFPCALLQTEQAITLAVSNLMEELAEQGLRYAEIRFAPQLHTHQGLTQQQVVRAATAGLEGARIPGSLILCCMRMADNLEENLATVEAAAEFLGHGVCAVDLAGAEALFPTENFEPVFRLARQKQIPMTIHAGEAAGPDSIRKALEFGARRIGHGVRCLEDPELVRHLAQTGVTLELCPTSNLNTCIFPDIRSYPLRQLMAAGVKVCINTDNMTVSGVTIRSEMALVAETFSLTEEELAVLLRNGVDACFASDAVKSELIQVLDKLAN